MATTTQIPPALMTAEAFAAFVARPENADRCYELDEGRVIEVPPPKLPHGFVLHLVCLVLERYRAKRGRGFVCSGDVGFLVSRDPDTVRGPDAMYFERTASLADLVADNAYAETPPLLAVEILSPTNRWGLIARKVAQYHAAGVKVVWIVEPSVREVTVHLHDAEPRTFGLGESLPGSDALPGFECRVDELFELPQGE